MCFIAEVYTAKLLRKSGAYLLVALFTLIACNGYSQNNDYSFKSADQEVGMTVTRVQGGVDISLMLSKASQFDFVLIEKSTDAKNGFGQCKYIKFNESANDSVVIVKRDAYPTSSVEDMYYRIKTVSREGITRTYPSVRLPGLRDVKKQ